MYMYGTFARGVVLPNARARKNLGHSDSEDVKRTKVQNYISLLFQE